MYWKLAKCAQSVPTVPQQCAHSAHTVHVRLQFFQSTPTVRPKGFFQNWLIFDFFCSFYMEGKIVLWQSIWLPSSRLWFQIPNILFIFFCYLFENASNLVKSMIFLTIHKKFTVTFQFCPILIHNLSVLVQFFTNFACLAPIFAWHIFQSGFNFEV